MYATTLHASTRETPAELRWPYECGICVQPCDDATILGSCTRCYLAICDDHDRALVSVPGGKILYCSACQAAEKLANCADCGHLFSAVKLHGEDPACNECRLKSRNRRKEAA